MPASVTYATRLPARTASTTQSALSRSLCACTARSRPAAGISAWVSSARVRRVSSAAITSASRSASTARGERSPRLPIGVATSTSTPARRSSAPRSGAVASARSRPQLHAVAAREPPAVERARLGLHHERGARARSATPATAPASPCAARHPRRRRTRRRSRTACRRCGRGGTGAAPARPRTRRGRAGPRRRARAVSATSTAASTSPSRTSQAIAAAPSHVEADLEHVAVDDLVVLPLDAQLALFLGLRPRADVEELLPVDHLGPDEARAAGRSGSRPRTRAPWPRRGTSRRAIRCRRW